MSTVKEASTTVAKVLVVEDDAPTRQQLGDHLEADHFEVAAVGSAAEARSLLAAGSIDLVLLDLTLPDDALGLLREIHQGQERVGVIIVTGRSTERERIRGLNEGAEDYISKPFSYGELLARMNAVLRRLKKAGEPVTRVGEIEINNRTGKVTVSGREVRLTAKELALLKVLAAEPTRVFSREQLLSEVWGYRSIGHTRTLDAHCARLRSKLDPEHGRLVVSCWGVGWRLLGL